MRIMLRLMSVLFLVGSILVGVVDSIQSVSASRVVLTPLATTVAALGDQGLTLVQTLEKADGGVMNGAVHWLMRQPACAGFLFVALLFWMLAYRDARRERGLSAV